MTFHESRGLAWCRVEQPTFPDCKNDTWPLAETTFRPNPDETLKNSESCPMESVNPRDTAPIQRISRTACCATASNALLSWKRAFFSNQTHVCRATPCATKEWDIV